MIFTLMPVKSRQASSAWGSNFAFLRFAGAAFRRHFAFGPLGEIAAASLSQKNGSQDNIASTGAGKNNGHIIRLFRIAYPSGHRACNSVANFRERLVPMFPEQRDQPFLSELA